MEDGKLIINRTIIDNSRGNLSFFESNKDIPFEIKRIYYIYDVPLGIKRGMHAHKELEQILWCPYGRVKIILKDGYNENSYILDSPEKALIVNKGIWREMYWLEVHSVLCVGASSYYDEEDYIRTYDEFLSYIKKGN